MAPNMTGSSYFLEPINTTLYGKRDFTDVIFSQWGDYPGLSRWSHIIIRILMRGKQETRVGEADMMIEAEVQVDVATMQQI